MNVRTKVILNYPLILWRNFRAKGLAKKIQRFANEQRYSEQFKNDLMIKRSKQILKVFKVEIETIGYENVPKSSVILTPNHSSSFDGIVIMAALENKEKGPDHKNHQVVFLAKDSLKKNKKAKHYASIINTFYVEQENPRQILEVLNEISIFAKNNKKHIVIFPEGTRSHDGRIGEFKPGAFKIAKSGFLPIVPVTINNALSITDLNRNRKIKIQVIFHPIIKPMSFVTSETKSIAERVQKIVASKWIAPEGKRPPQESKLA